MRRRRARPGRRCHAQGRAGVPRRGAGRWQRPHGALLTIADEIESGLRPALVIAVPVGFVNVVESKERLFAVCTQYGVPAIAAMGRKGGSNVAAAICNALVYSAAEMLDPCGKRLAVIHFLPQVFPYNREFWRGGGVLPPPLFVSL